jgi:endonuclease/exonuclease/phosphatase family metal-dependent hydrolase
MAYARILVLVFVLAAPALCAAGDAGRNDGAITVMTRNLYFGADLGPAVAATTVPQLIAAATQIFGVVQASDIPGRADVIAAEIAAARPDLVGLQEVALWRSQFPPDFAPAPDATTVEFDFLQLLLDALAARGVAYDVVAVHVSNDLEAPALTATGVCCREIRFTDREVILARAARAHNDPLVVTNVEDGTFVAQAAVPLPSGVLYRERRGWLAADVVARGAEFRFVTTHLLPAGPADFLQAFQGAELVTGPANTTRPVILVCDCNSPADGTGTTTYGDLLTAGFVDGWLERQPHLAGLTCCQAGDLRNPTSLFDQRIDLVLVRGRAHVRQIETVGDELVDRTADGLWASDHAGVGATVQLKP